ncbi:hypothetical protein LBMAG23_01510 [Bacteroidota bacterium]|nr:hypothetical protein LBMAG23_01510 [Bacteroidota bacterium]
MYNKLLRQAIDGKVFSEMIYPIISLWNIWTRNPRGSPGPFQEIGVDGGLGIGEEAMKQKKQRKHFLHGK